jgi:hypothetical protein
MSDSPSDYGRLVYYWLSFADKKAFRGVCVVRSQATDLFAIRESIAQGCNPGPEYDVRGFPLHEDIVPDPQFVNRLLTREEAEYLNESLKQGIAMPKDLPEEFEEE